MSGRYTHRVAISNNRLVDIEDNAVRFRWKDYRHGNRQKVMTLAADEFIRRFLLHVLPEGFQRIRHYGFLANGRRQAKLAHIRQFLPAKPPQEGSAADHGGDTRVIKQEGAETTTSDDDDAWKPMCPQCGGNMEIVERLPAPRHRRARRIDTS